MADQSSKCPTNIILGQPFVLLKVKCYFLSLYNAYYRHILYNIHINNIIQMYTCDFRLSQIFSNSVKYSW